MTRRRAVSWTQLELPFTPLAFDVADLPDRIAARIDVDPTGCWRWNGVKSSNQYGQVKHDGVQVMAHRLVWHLLVDADLVLRPGRAAAVQLDHRCRVPACVNPAHLEPVTNRENQIRGRQGVLGAHGSRFVGVHRQGNRWRAQLEVDGVNVRLGCFLTEHAAAVVYDAASYIAYGDDTNHRFGLLADPPPPTAIALARRQLERVAARAADRSAS